MEEKTININIDDYEITLLVDNEMLNRRVDNTYKEKQLIVDLLSNLKNDNIFYDIGSNIGTHSLFASHIITSGEIHAFEPHPYNYSSLLNNIEINEKSNIYTHNIALFDKSGEMNFDPINKNTGEGRGFLSLDGVLEVKTKRADELSLPAPDIVKIDVEGAELKVMRGMSNMLSDIKIIYIEVHPSRMIEYFDSNFSELIKLAGDNNFKLELLFSRGDEKFYKLIKQ